MTDFTTIFVPEDSSFTPSADSAEAGKRLLDEKFLEWGAEAEYKIWPVSRLITSGDAFDRFTCPKCSTVVMMRELRDDGLMWWYSNLEKITESVATEVPCCGAVVLGREFDFGGEARFARFQVSIDGPGGDFGDVDEALLSSLESILGCRLRRITYVET